MDYQIPKYIFDKEYSTQWKREVKFLEDKGINYTYAKKHYKYPIITYKYTKTPELFLALAEYYNQVRTEQIHKRIDKMPLEQGYISVKESELSDAEKKTITGEDLVAVIQDDTE